MNYQTIKKNFDKGLWTASMVKNAVKKGLISKEKYKDIVGKDYE